MAVDALWRENAVDHNAVQYRQMMAGLAGWRPRTLGGSATSGTANGGVLGPVPSATTGPLAVTERGAGANMSVDVAVGGAMVGGTAGAGSAHRGDYFAYNDATLNVPISASDPTNPRIDLVGIRIRDTAYGEADNTPVITVVTGTAAGVPAEPAVPDNFLTLARVDVPAADTAIGAAQITDRRRPWTALGGTIVRATDAMLPTVDLWNGMVALVLAHSSYSNAPMVMARIGGAWVPWKRLDSFATPSGEQVLLAESNPSGTGTVPLWNASLVGIRHLILRWTAKTTNAAEQDLQLRLNNDSAAAAYHYEQITETASGAPATAGTDATYFKAGRLARTGGVNDLSTGVTEINDLDMPLGSDVPMLARWWEGVPGVMSELGLGGGMWKNGATVTRVDVAAAAGNFTAGSRFTLYGIRA